MTVRAILATNKEDSKGRCPIKIVVTIAGKRSYQSTGIRIKEDDWNGTAVKKNAKDAAGINTIIKAKIALAEEKIINQQAKGKKVNVRTVLRDEDEHADVYEYADKLLKEVGKKKYAPGYVARFKYDMDRLKAFAPGLTFEDVDHSFLRRYEGYLRETRIDADGNKSELAGNTIHRIWKRLRSVFNSARMDGVTDNNPFHGYKNPKYQQTIRTYLLSDEVQLIEEALNKPLAEYQIVTANYFLLGAYSGLRHSDWIRFNHAGFVQGERILLRTKKTGEIVSLQMHARLKAVVDRLRDLPGIYSEPKTNEYLKGLATIAGIKKHLTTHVARHSFAVRCAELDISPSVTAELMGISLRTVMVYYRITNRKIDAEVMKWDSI